MSVRAVQPLLLIILFSSLCFFTRLGATRLWDRDEPRNAQCAWEMYQRGDWVVPTFNGELRAHKPILLYWFTMPVYAVLGVSEFSARFTSAALAVGTVLLTYQIGGRLFGGRVALWSALILASTLMFNVAAHAATPDSTLIFFSTLAMSLFLHGIDWHGFTVAHLQGQAGPPTIDRRWLAAAALAIGLAVLAKGPVGMVLPVAVWSAFFWTISAAAAPPALSWHVWPKRWLLPRMQPAYLLACLRAWHPLQTLGLALLLAAPWYVLVGVRTDGEWLREFFWRHNVGRALQPLEGHRGNLLWFYPVAILIGFFPWSSLAIPVALWTAGRQQARRDPRCVLLFCWVVTYLIVFSLASTKLPSYVTPTYPALAVLVGHFVANWSRSSSSPARWWPRWSAATLIVVGIVLVIALPLVVDQFLPGESRLARVGWVLLIGGVGCLWCFWRGQFQVGMRCLAGTSLVFVVVLFGWVAPRVSSHQQIESLLAVARRHDPNAPLVSLGVHEPSWVYYARREIPLLNENSLDAACHLLTDRHGLLITSRTTYERLSRRLPSATAVLGSVPYFLRDDQLLLLGTPAGHTADASFACH